MELALLSLKYPKHLLNVRECAVIRMWGWRSYWLSPISLTGMVKCETVSSSMWISGWLLFYFKVCFIFWNSFLSHLFIISQRGAGKYSAFIAILMFTREKIKFTQSLAFSSWKYVLKITHKALSYLSLSSAPFSSPFSSSLRAFTQMKLILHGNSPNQGLFKNPQETLD